MSDDTIMEVHFFRYRFLVLIRIRNLLKKAKRLIKVGQIERSKIFIDAAKESVDRYIEASK